MGKVKPGVTIRGGANAGRGDDPHGVTQSAYGATWQKLQSEDPDFAKEIMTEYEIEKATRPGSRMEHPQSY